MYTLLYNPGCGSAIIEAAFEWTGLPYQLEEVEPWKAGPAHERLRSVNPLMQVPTLILPDQSIMTESAAMIFHLHDRVPQAGLIPDAHDFRRPVFLRWFIFLVAAVYPTFSYGDEPSRYVSGEEAQKELRECTDAQRIQLFTQLEAASHTPWFLGEKPSAIDLYLAVMSHWRPGRDFFERECQRIASIAYAIETDDRFAPVFARNFPAP